MTTELTELRVSERRGTLWQIAVLDVVRLLIRSGADHLDAAAIWSALAGEATRRAHQHGAYAIAEGDSYAEVARALGISRQAATKRYRVTRSARIRMVAAKGSPATKGHSARDHRNR